MIAPTLGATSWMIDAQPDPVRTLQTMSRYVREALADPSIVRYSNEIVEHVHARDYPGQVAMIKTFLERYFRFINNPVGVQRIRTPADMLLDIERKNFVWGACDDAAILVATLGMADALPARFRALAFGRLSTPDPTAPLTHVIADLFDGAQWCPLDITRPMEMDRPPYVVRTLTVTV